jgi:hypothetical protein
MSAVLTLERSDIVEMIFRHSEISETENMSAFKDSIKINFDPLY